MFWQDTIEVPNKKAKPLQEMEEEAFQALSKKGMKKPAAARPVKTMKKPAASNATSSAKASTTIFGCLRCRGASKGCDTCIQPNFTGLRLPGRKAWKKYMAQKDTKKAKKVKTVKKWE